MIRALARIVAAVSILALFTAPSLAQFVIASSSIPPDTVAVPVGDWVTQVAPLIQDALYAIVAGVVAFALRNLPAGIRTYVTAGITAQAEQLLEKAVDWAIASVAGATKDKIWTVSVGNSVVAQAVQYVVDHGPAWLITWLGGEAMIAQKIIARIGDLLPDNAQVAGSSTSTQITTGAVGAANAGTPAPTAAASTIVAAVPAAPVA